LNRNLRVRIVEKSIGVRQLRYQTSEVKTYAYAP
jgi:hypothetical protein